MYVFKKVFISYLFFFTSSQILSFFFYPPFFHLFFILSFVRVSSEQAVQHLHQHPAAHTH